MHVPEFNRDLELPHEAATQHLGELLAKCIQPGLVVYLEGDLGVGKTTLVRALLRALGYGGPVKSPTYALVEVYVISSLYLYHFDFYRFGSPEEFVDAGLGEYFREDSVCLVEWPEKAAGYVPPADLRLSIQHRGHGRRLIPIACSEEGQRCLTSLYAAWDAADSCTLPVQP